MGTELIHADRWTDMMQHFATYAHGPKSNHISYGFGSCDNSVRLTGFMGLFDNILSFRMDYNVKTQQK